MNLWQSQKPHSLTQYIVITRILEFTLNRFWLRWKKEIIEIFKTLERFSLCCWGNAISYLFGYSMVVIQKLTSLPSIYSSFSVFYQLRPPTDMFYSIRHVFFHVLLLGVYHSFFFHFSSPCSLFVEFWMKQSEQPEHSTHVEYGYEVFRVFFSSHEEVRDLFTKLFIFFLKTLFIQIQNS